MPTMIEADRSRLLSLLTELSFEKRDVVLASGKRSDFYVDCRQTTLNAEGHVLVGRLLLARIAAYEARTQRTVGAIGGMTMGADPIVSAVSLTSALAGRPIPGLLVRKEAKGHGTGRSVEGMKNVPAGTEVVVVEDTITTGGSALRAVASIREAGYTVRLVLGLVDRLEGGADAITAQDLELDPLFSRPDFP